MVVSVRAVYEEGQLRLLEPVDLAEGQVVDVTIKSEADAEIVTPEQVDARLRAAGLLVELNATEAGAELTPEERLEIGSRLLGDQSSEALIDKDRGSH